MKDIKIGSKYYYNVPSIRVPKAGLEEYATFVDEDDVVMEKPRKWVKPEAWPDIDKIPTPPNKEEIYLLFDTKFYPRDNSFNFISLTARGSYLVESGELNGDYQFNATSAPQSINNNLTFCESLVGNRYRLYRITPQEESHLTYFSLSAQVTNDPDLPWGTEASFMPLVAIVVNAPYLKTVSQLATSCTQYAKLANLTEMTTAANLFPGGYILEKVEMPGTTFEKAVTARSFLVNCYKLYDLDISDVTFSDKLTDCGYMFNNCQALTSLDVSVFHTQNVTNFTAMFSSCMSLKKIKGIEFMCVDSATNMSQMFASVYNLEELDLSYWTTGKLTNVSMFIANCYKLRDFKMPAIFDTSDCTTFNSFMASCRCLEEISLRNMNVSGKATDLGYMFNGCTQLKKIERGAWHVENVTDMTNMFNGCQSLQELDVSDWNDTSKVKNMSNMFRNLYRVTSLDISFLKTTQVPTNNLTALVSGLSVARNIKLPNDLKVAPINLMASDKAVEKVVVPETVTSIMTSAFYNLRCCKAILFTNHTAVPTISSVNDIVNATNPNIKIVIPDALYNQWIAAPVWKTPVLKDKIVKQSEYTG
jgi:surface protein